MTTLSTYYQQIRARINSNQFSIKAQKAYRDKTGLDTNEQKESFREACRANSHLESIHYLMYEYWKDRDDPRTLKYFQYVCVPDGVNDPNSKDEHGNVLDIDFCKWEPELFIKEVMKLKVN